MSALLDLVAQARLRVAGFRPQRVPTTFGEINVLVAKGGGDLPPLIMLHGVSSRGSHYRTLAPGLLRHFSQIVLPDFLGHGASAPPSRWDTPALMHSMGEALDALIGDTMLLYGNSMGGYAAIKIAAARPGKVRGVLVTSPAGGPMPDAVRAEVLGRFKLRDRAATLHLMERAFARPPAGPLRPLFAHVIEAQLQRPAVRRLLEAIVPSDDLTPEELAALQVPLRVIWGTADRLLADEQREWYRQNLPSHAIFDEPPDYGHSAYLERAADLRARILRFAQDAAGR